MMMIGLFDDVMMRCLLKTLRCWTLDVGLCRGMNDGIANYSTDGKRMG